MYSRHDKPNIYDAISIAKCTLSALVLVEYSGVGFNNVIGVKLNLCGQFATIRFTPKGFEIIKKKSIPGSATTWETMNYSLTYCSDLIIKQFSTSEILKQFPFFEQILDVDKYNNITKEISEVELFERCKLMQKMMMDWSSSSGMAHLISSLQALQRYLASEMREPLALNFEVKFDNGLSIEYQCEIYADHLYGAKLLAIWHHYLLDAEQKHPDNFFGWLKRQPKEVLNKFGISNIKDISEVIYMTPQDRKSWHLQFGYGNTVQSERLPAPKRENEVIEIIYTLGKSEQDPRLEFFGGIKKRGIINHSSFFSGKKVNGAGRIVLKAEKSDDGLLRWYVKDIDNNSGHIKPNDEMSVKTLTRLQEMGLNLKTIHWSSKWGTRGAIDETADIALKRLTNNLDAIDMKHILTAAKQTMQTPLLSEIKECATHGYLGALHDVILLKGYQATISESYAIAIYIREALLNHIKIFSYDAATPSLVRVLRDYATNFLRNTGSYSEQFEKSLDDIIKEYSKIQAIREQYGPEVVDINLREVPLFKSKL